MASGKMKVEDAKAARGITALSLELVENTEMPLADDDTIHVSGAHKPLAPDLESIQHSYPFDRLMHAWIGKTTAGISPISLTMAFFDWAAHSSIYPAKHMELMKSAGDKAALLLTYLTHYAIDQETPPVAQPKPRDRRFGHEGWNTWPFNMYEQAFLLNEQCWNEATKDVRGVSRHHQEVVNFTMRQLVDMFSPSNNPWKNPEVMEALQEQGGQNFVEGAKNFLEDLTQLINDAPPPGAEKYRPGKEVAVTKGKVIYRNRLMELIQYSPTTQDVYAEPIFIIPAWIMKYYILDLSPHNSLVKYLVDKGHTVFMISWKNPDVGDRDLGFEDYIRMGVLEGLTAVRHIVPERNIHMVGYCLGGTLLMMAAAVLARQNVDTIKTITLFAAQVDYEEAGELMLFTDESQIACTEDTMWQQGYLDKHQMAGAFSMLRSNDLIWSRLIHSYMLGKRRGLNDLMAWNADATRMPFKMHSDYLRKLYLNNELSEGHFKIDGKPVILADINNPIFAVGTTRDHVAPWTSVYKLNFYTDTDVTFALTTGGHNAGIVNPVDDSKYSYQIDIKHKDDSYTTPATWAENTLHHEGSWWKPWQDWLAQHSDEKTAPPPMGHPAEDYKPLCDAPGTYVHQK